MKTIIIPTDFSPIATNALHYGIDMAQTINASVLLMHVYQVPLAIADVPVVVISEDELKNNAEEKLNVYPNPNQGEFDINLNLEKSTELKVMLYDLSGKLIFEERKSGFIGIYNRKIELRAHPQGMYFLSVSTNGNVVTEKILYTRN